MTESLGDEQLEALLREHREGLVRYLTLTGVSDPESLAQQTCVTAWDLRANFEGRSTPSTWLFGIARNLARNERRRKTPTGDASAIDQQPTPRGVLTSVARRELAERLELAIGRLPRAFAEAFVLHHMDGLSFKDIAAVAETTEATARVRAHRAKHLLQRELGAFELGA